MWRPARRVDARRYVKEQVFLAGEDAVREAARAPLPRKGTAPPTENYEMIPHFVCGRKGESVWRFPNFSGLARPPRAEAEKKAEARRDTLPNANATHPSAMAKDLYAATGNHEKRGSRAAAFCLFK